MFPFCLSSFRDKSRSIFHGQVSDLVCIQLPVRLHGGAVPDQLAVIGAGGGVAGRPGRLHTGAANTSPCKNYKFKSFESAFPILFVYTV